MTNPTQMHSTQRSTAPREAHTNETDISLYNTPKPRHGDASRALSPYCSAPSPIGLALEDAAGLQWEGGPFTCLLSQTGSASAIDGNTRLVKPTLGNCILTWPGHLNSGEKEAGSLDSWVLRV